MIDIYNEKLAKYADGERRIFTATFLRPDDRKGIVVANTLLSVLLE